MADAPKKLPVETEKKPMAKAETFASPFQRLHREIDRLFDDFGRVDWRLPFSRGDFGLDMKWPSRTDWEIAPAMDVAEKDTEYEVTAELPGIEDKDIEIKLANGMLTIKGEKSEEKEEKQKEYYLSERRFGSFQRSFTLPEGVDTDKIEASFAKGILSVKLPKSAKAREAEKKIAVKAA
jgi:HSP20 family protein